MASSFQDLVGMDLRSLASWLRSERYAAGLDQQEIRGLVEIFATRLLNEAANIAPNEWSEFSAVLDGTMLSAGLDRIECAIGRLNLTSALIAAVGPSPDYSLRDPNTAAHVFLDVLPMELDEASALAVDWRQASRDDIRRLRSIKNLLKPLVDIEIMVSDVAAKEAVGRWMALYNALP